MRKIVYNDIGCNLIVVPWWESNIRLDLGVSVLGVTRICHEILKPKEREKERERERAIF